MSSPIWTRCAGAERLTRLVDDAWRVVETQHVAATRKLVDSDEEQGILEELLEGSKPPLRPAEEGLQYLLFTPFRYPPLRHGSRFGTRAERGIFYAATAPGTAFAEVAYYRWLFLAGSTAALAPLRVDLTLFVVELRTDRGIDLTAPPFDAHEAELASPTSYAVTQPLGRAMREAGVHAFRFRSARDPGGGVNLGVVVPEAFATRAPRATSSWLATIEEAVVEVQRIDPLAPRTRHRFERVAIEVDGALPVVG